MKRVDLLSLDAAQMEGLVRDLGWPRYRAAQLLQWIYQKRVRDFSGMTNLGKTDRERLERHAVIHRMDWTRHLTSSDGTEKFLFRLSDGQEIESVLIPGDEAGDPSADRRLTLCLSTQVGCTLDCRFCLTGTMGLIRNLKAHEIVDQVLELQRAGRRMTNFVMMGMGEPLANYNEVVEAIGRLTAPRMLALSPRRITVSTSGLVPQIHRLGKSGLKMNLAVSLNATTDAVRDRIMPEVNRLYPIKALMAACRGYHSATRRKLFFEYVLLSGVNDSGDDARRLTGLLRGIPSKVNLIPFNEFPDSPFRRPDDGVVLKFQKILMEAGITTFIRKSRGSDILAACGQLRTEAKPGDAPIIPIKTQAVKI
jgi:23S rRNA (adenine2503-C2)-methyltransferase